MKNTLLKILITDPLPANETPDVLMIDSGILSDGELMPGIVLFNAPASYLPIRAFIESGSDLENFVIQDSEQTVIFSASHIAQGITCLNLFNNQCPPFLPTLNLSYSGAAASAVRVIIEYQLSPFSL